MIRPVLAALCVFALHALAEAPPAKPKLVVVPFAALSGDVPPRTGTKALGMLTTEFKGVEAFVLLEAKKELGADAAGESLTLARKAVADAKALREKKKFRLAQEALQQALAAYQAGAPALADLGEVVDAYALSAAVAYATGRDEEGAKALTQALALAPDRELPLAQTSPLFAQVVAEARKQLKAGSKGELVLESAPTNAPVLLDGQALGSTPLSVREVPPGLHLWSARLPTGETLGGAVEVVAGKTAQVKATSLAKDPEARLLVGVAQNRVDAEVVAAVREVAKAAEAEYVVFGALSKDGKGLALDTFLFAAARTELRRLPRAQFDAELLSAGLAFFTIAGELSKKGVEVGEPVKLPASVAGGALVVGPKLAEARFGMVPGREAAQEAVEGDAKDPAAADGTRKPIEGKRRVPLKKQ